MYTYFIVYLYTNFTVFKVVRLVVDVKNYFLMRTWQNRFDKLRDHNKQVL